MTTEDATVVQLNARVTELTTRSYTASSSQSGSLTELLEPDQEDVTAINATKKSSPAHLRREGGL